MENPAFNGYSSGVVGGSETGPTGDGDGDSGESSSASAGDGDGDVSGDGDGDGEGTGDGDGDGEEPGDGDGDGDEPELACAETLVQACNDGLRGLGEQCFSEASPVAQGFIISDLVVLDFNEDGFDDLAYTQLGTSKLELLIGSPEGLLEHGNLSTAGFTALVDAADFNNDGHIDLVAIRPEPITTRVWLGNGGGGFTLTSEASPEFFDLPLALGHADLDQDGDQDLIVRMFYVLVPFEGIGNGGLLPGNPLELPEGWGGEALLIADVVGNDAPDVVISAYAEDALIVFENGGDNQYAESVLADFGPGSDGPTVLRMEDLDQDGDRDIMTNSVDNEAVIPLLRTNAEPPFETGSQNAGDSRSGFALADFDHDCAPDLIKSVKSFNAASLELWSNANDGSAKFSSTDFDFDYPEQDLIAVEVGDFNGDGNADFVTASSTAIWTYHLEP